MMCMKIIHSVALLVLSFIALAILFAPIPAQAQYWCGPDDDPSCSFCGTDETGNCLCCVHIFNSPEETYQYSCSNLNLPSSQCAGGVPGRGASAVVGNAGGVNVTGVDNYCKWCGGPQRCCVTAGPIMATYNNSSLQPWLISFYQNQMRPALRQMSDRVAGMIMLQSEMLGGFYDAQNSQSAQLSLQKLKTQVYRDYVPGDALCQFGTLSRSLAASEGMIRSTKLGMSERYQNRMMMNYGSLSASAKERGRETGRVADKQARLQQFKSKFCDKSEMGLAAFCNGATDKTFNRDISYARTVDAPLTLDLKFTSPAGAASADQESLLALGNNIYGNDIILNPPDENRLNPGTPDNPTLYFMDYRSIVAKRSVAQNTLASIAALKTPGTDASTQYMRQVMANLGTPAADIDRIIGTQNPSYFAQMDILTNRLYQDPAFFANLMDKSVNIARSQASLKAIGLMQNNDMYDSAQRTEMLLATLLELYVLRDQNKLRDRTAQ